LDQYNDMTPAARFADLELNAIAFFGTPHWKTAFCNRYGFTPQTLTKWKNEGAPVWAAQAMRDAWQAKRLTEAVRTIQSIDFS
jgi:hypothetical protein